MYYENDNWFGNVIWLLVLLVFAFAILALAWSEVSFTDHAMTSHATQISDINHCFNGGGVRSPWYRIKNGRYAQYCTEYGGKYNYFRIFSCDGADRIVVTQFKQALRKLQNYLRNHEAIPMASPPPCN